jgi:hypothetical protein
MQDILIDTDNWPIVHVKMPQSVAEGAEVGYLQDMQSILDRNEPHVMIYEGPEKLDAPAFNAAYMKWYKSVKEQQNRLLKGIARIDPENAGNKSLIAAAKEKIAKLAVPYPYEICSSMEDAKTLAQTWLAAAKP